MANKKSFKQILEESRNAREEDKDNHAIGFMDGWQKPDYSRHQYTDDKRAMKKVHKGFKKGLKYRTYFNKQARRAKKVNYGRN